MQNHQISVPSERAVELAEKLLSSDECVRLAGLGKAKHLDNFSTAIRNRIDMGLSFLLILTDSGLVILHPQKIKVPY